MLNWWLGRPAEDAPGDGDTQEPPETPAPLFAARAIKSALFGTPGFRDEIEPVTPSIEASTKLEGTREAATVGAISPTKPQGILLTPGTASMRRKTVSFGEEVVDNEDKNAIGKSGLPSSCPGKYPSPWTPRVEDKQKNMRRTTLTRTLEAARNEKNKKSNSTKVNGMVASETSPGTNTTNNTGVFGSIGHTAISQTDDFDGDMTLDLNKPCSQSGRYWKTEYEKYHEEAMEEMRKLVKYKQLAKSYAKKKDSEAIDLGEKLREEQQKVANMEAKVTELTMQIANRRLEAAENEFPEMIKNLARQTTLAMSYKEQVDQLQTALQAHDAHLHRQGKVNLEKHSSVVSTANGLENYAENKSSRKQFEEMDLLRNELQSLRLNLLAAERKVTKLHDENARLSKDLASVNEALEKSEKRRRPAEIHSEESGIVLQSLQKDYDILKEKAKSQRREAETLLHKRYKQIATLKAEIALLKGKNEDSSPRAFEQVPPRNPSENTSQTGQDEAKSTDLKIGANDAEDLISFGSPRQPKKRTYEDLLDKPQAKKAPDAVMIRTAEYFVKQHQNSKENCITAQPEDVNLLDDRITGSDCSVWRPNTSDNGLDPSPIVNTPGNGKQRLSHTALSEIINNADANASPAQPGKQLTPGFQKRFSNLSLESPKFDLPSIERSCEYGPTWAARSKHYGASPRPSMFNIAASPPKQIFDKARASAINIDTKHPSQASSRLSSMSSRGRATLPPDRAAAAKARLEQKNAEKRRAQIIGNQKENLR